MAHIGQEEFFGICLVFYIFLGLAQLLFYFHLLSDILRKTYDIWFCIFFLHFVILVKQERFLICLTNDPENKETMIAMFKAVLERLASRGFKKVRFTAKLCHSPECLSDFIKDAQLVPVIEQSGGEIIIGTELP